MTPEMQTLIDRALAGVAPVRVSTIPPWYASAEEAHAFFLGLAAGKSDEPLYREGVEYWAARCRGEDVGPVPNTGPVRSGTSTDFDECPACQ
jgi:hypothetical protein